MAYVSSVQPSQFQEASVSEDKTVCNHDTRCWVVVFGCLFVCLFVCVCLCGQYLLVPAASSKPPESKPSVLEVLHSFWHKIQLFVYSPYFLPFPTADFLNLAVKSPSRARLTGGRACWRERGHSYRSISSYRKLPPPACPGTTCKYYE